MERLTTSIDRSVEDAIEAADFDWISRTYWNQNEVVFLEHFLPFSMVMQFLSDVNRVRDHINRNYIPWRKKGGAVSFHALLRQAPAIISLYRSPAFLDFLSRLVKAPLMLCPEDDLHSCALYVYNEPGDHIGWHYDTSYYKGPRYTILVGLIERSEQCRLVAQLYQDDPGCEIQELRISMEPGSMVIFNGDKLWHAVTPLEEGAERIMLALEYVTNQNMGFFQRALSNLKDTLAYFGPTALVRRPPLGEHSLRRSRV